MQTLLIKHAIVNGIWICVFHFYLAHFYCHVQMMTSWVLNAYAKCKYQQQMQTPLMLQVLLKGQMANTRDRFGGSSCAEMLLWNESCKKKCTN